MRLHRKSEHHSGLVPLALLDQCAGVADYNGGVVQLNRRPGELAAAKGIRADQTGAVGKSSHDLRILGVGPLNRPARVRFLCGLDRLPQERWWEPEVNRVASPDRASLGLRCKVIEVGKSLFLPCRPAEEAGHRGAAGLSVECGSRVLRLVEPPLLPAG